MKKQIVAVYRKVPVLQVVYRLLRATYARARLKRQVAGRIKHRQPLRVVIGANNKFQPGWIPTEIYTLNCLCAGDWRRYFRENCIDALLAEHVWEHLTVEDGVHMAKLCFQHLKPGGHLRVAVPDGCFPDERYIESVKPGGNGPSAHDHKVLFTYRTFQEVFERAGFKVKLLEYFDSKGEFHSQDWDPNDGKIVRSMRFYAGHQYGKYKYRSLILDAVKPLGAADGESELATKDEALAE